MLVSYHVQQEITVKSYDIDVENIGRFVKQREEERKRLEEEKLEQERREQEKLDQERLEQERLEQERLEQERQEEEKRRSAEQKRQQEQQKQEQKQQSNNSNTQSGKQPNNQGSSESSNQQSTATYQGINSFERDVVKYTNIERVKHGLPELKMDNKLSEVAWYKSRDMQVHGYFDHTSPTYGSPFDMMRHYGVSFTAAGENIAAGYSSAMHVVDAWMNSEGHRKNILDPNYTHIGVGYLSNDHYSTQMFIKK
ncbi:serine protease [Bacillus tamaricis]|uniref:Serine protease n=2 Tax=Evansella tamaricis TaxID=2069301 RepID=A0ABS6JH37_9BACI|nr:serine protease [Evansella tamaricis]